MKKQTSKPKILCITGRMGTGKSTVAAYFRDRWNIPVYIADDRAKFLMNHDENLKKSVRKSFGNDSYHKNVLNTAYLAEQVFGNAEKLKELENLVHPVVQKDFTEWMRNREAPYVILENAVLEKSGMDKNCDFILVVDAPEHIIIERVRKRNGWTEAHIRNRLKHQKPFPADKQNTFYIENCEDFNKITSFLNRLHENLLK